MLETQIPLSARARNTIGKIFFSSEHHDINSFMELASDNIELRVGSRPPARGKTAVRPAVWLILHAMRSVQHRLIDAWERDDTLAIQGEATGIALDGQHVCVTYVDVVEFEGDRIRRYFVNMDPTPMLTVPAIVVGVALAGVGSLLTFLLLRRKAA